MLSDVRLQHCSIIFHTADPVIGDQWRLILILAILKVKSIKHVETAWTISTNQNTVTKTQSVLLISDVQ